jgi:hypothetical protein
MEPLQFTKRQQKFLDDIMSSRDSKKALMDRWDHMEMFNSK